MADLISYQCNQCGSLHATEDSALHCATQINQPKFSIGDIVFNYYGWFDGDPEWVIDERVPVEERCRRTKVYESGVFEGKPVNCLSKPCCCLMVVGVVVSVEPNRHHRFNYRVSTEALKNGHLDGLNSFLLAPDKLTQTMKDRQNQIKDSQ